MSGSGFPSSVLGGALPAAAVRFQPKASDGWGPGLLLALGIHLMLVAALALGVSWKSHTPEAVEAEMWDAIPQVAAPVSPPPPPPSPAPEPRQAEPPKAQPEATKPPPEPEPVPDVVVARTPKKEPRKEPKKHEPREVFEDTKPAKPVKKAEPPKPEPKPEPKVAPKPEPVKAPPKPAEAKTPPKPSTAEADARAASDREAQRKANLARMMSDLGGSSLGTSNRNAGPTAGYAGRIRARIKPNIVFADNVNGNPLAVVEVRCAPDGRIMSRKVIESSGVPAWDEAVLRALERTEVLPADENGRVQPVMELRFRPNDF